MGWLTKISHVLFRKDSDDIKQIFNNNIHLPDGIASFDSSSHYIEAPYSYIHAFEEQMFDKYYDNAVMVVQEGFANSADALFDPRFKTIEGTQDIMTKIVKNLLKKFF